MDSADVSPQSMQMPHRWRQLLGPIAKDGSLVGLASQEQEVELGCGPEQERGWNGPAKRRVVSGLTSAMREVCCEMVWCRASLKCCGRHLAGMHGHYTGMLRCHFCFLSTFDRRHQHILLRNRVAGQKAAAEYCSHRYASTQKASRHGRTIFTLGP